jgi:deoxyribose-phosphate aldolase
VASVCVKPCQVRLAAGLLVGSDVLVGTVVGFPHGSSTTETKVAEARQAITEGAVELDLVLNIGELRSGHADYVRHDIKAVVDVAHAHGARVKVILENAYLTDEQKVLACRLCEEAGADWVKTSTGFAATGAAIADIKLMRQAVSERVQIKAAHGVRTLASALEMIDAGVTRIGATATATMLDDFRKLKENGAEAAASDGAEASSGY